MCLDRLLLSSFATGISPAIFFGFAFFPVNCGEQLVSGAYIRTGTDGKFQYPAGFVQIAFVIKSLGKILERADEHSITLVIAGEDIYVGGAVHKL